DPSLILERSSFPRGSCGMESSSGWRQGPFRHDRPYSRSRTGLVRETQVMQQQQPGRGAPIGPLDWLKIVPFQPVASSDRLGWGGREAARYGEAASELTPPAITHHRLVLFARPPKEMDLLYDGVKRHVPPPASAISLVPAGTPSRWRCRGSFDFLH